MGIKLFLNMRDIFILVTQARSRKFAVTFAKLKTQREINYLLMFYFNDIHSLYEKINKTHRSQRHPYYIQCKLGILFLLFLNPYVHILNEEIIFGYISRYNSWNIFYNKNISEVLKAVPFTRTDAALLRECRPSPYF